MSDQAKQAAAEIADKVMGYREFDVEATAEIIQRALLSAQRPKEGVMLSVDEYNRLQALSTKLEACLEALNKIASWGEGAEVNSSFDEPVSAKIARAALQSSEGKS